VVVVDEPVGVLVVVVEVELSLFGAGLTIVVSFFSPGVTTVVFSLGGTLTFASHAASSAATPAQSIIFFTFTME